MSYHASIVTLLNGIGVNCSAKILHRVTDIKKKINWNPSDELRYFIITYELRSALADTLIELSCRAVPAVSLYI